MKYQQKKGCHELTQDVSKYRQNFIKWTYPRQTRKKERKTTVMSLKRNRFLCKNKESFSKANSKRTGKKMRESYTG
jgi:hypothetical protein